MGENYTVGSVSELVSLLKKHSKQREAKVRAAARRAASKGRAYVKRNVPVAHGEIRESVHTEDAMLLVTAPHAAAVNFGSRPHTPPLAPLIEWVKLRGMQGLGTERQISRLPGTTTAKHARGIAGVLASMESGGALSVNAPEQVARAIQQSIAKHGTKPHHFIERALPELRAILGEELKAAVNSAP